MRGNGWIRHRRSQQGFGAKLLSPVITPVRNILPRAKGHGRSVEFKAVTSYNSIATTGWTTEGVSGPEIQTNTVDCVFPYKIASMRNYLTFEGFYTAKGQSTPRR